MKRLPNLAVPNRKHGEPRRFFREWHEGTAPWVIVMGANSYSTAVLSFELQE